MTDEPFFTREPNKPLRHRAFFSAASRYPEGSHEYQTTLAGLLTLRLIDKWPEPKGTTPDDNDARISDFVPVKNTIETLADTPIKHALAGLLDAISSFSYGKPDSRLAPLIAYAQLLEDRQDREPAADAYETATEIIKATARDPELLLMCYGRAAQCLRHVGQLQRAHALLSAGIEAATGQNDAATAGHRDHWLHRMRIDIATLAAEMLEQSQEWDSAATIYLGAIDLIKTREPDKAQLLRCYERAAYCLRQIGQIERAKDLLNDGIALALEMQDVRWSLYLRISSAVLELQKGNLSDADAALDAIIADAENAREQEMVARAKHERGVVAYERKQYERAVELFHAAARDYADPRMRRRVLPDVAMALSDLGHHDYARKVYLAVRNAKETEPEPRTIAGLNLMRLGEMSGDRALFDRFRVEIEEESMSGRLRAHSHLIAGQGFRRFGQIVAARRAFEQAIVLADTHHVYKLLTEAQAMLSATDDRPIPWKQPDESPSLSGLFNEIDTQTGVFAGATYE